MPDSGSYSRSAKTLRGHHKLISSSTAGAFVERGMSPLTTANASDPDLIQIRDRAEDEKSKLPIPRQGVA